MKIIQVLLMFCFTLLTISGSAQTYTPTESFIEIDGLAAMQISTAEEERGIVSKNKVKLNVQALLNGSSVRGVVDSRELVTDPDAGKGFDMQLPDGTVVTLVTHRVHSYVQGVETYSGRLKDIETGYFTLSVENDKVFGQVNIEYMAYDLSYDKVSRSHVLKEIDKAKMPKNSPEPLGDGSAYKKAPQAKDFPSPMLSGSAIGTVRVLILHGSDVPSPGTLASNIISSMNDTFFDDGMDPDLHFTLADLRNLNDDLEDVCKADIADLMNTPSAPFTNIATWIDDEDADVVLTVVTTDEDLTPCPGYGTTGRIGGIASDWLNSNLPYAITMDTYAIGDLTAAHEIGHVLGGMHSNLNDYWLQDYSPDSELYARGYTHSDGDWQTVMGGYHDGCDFVLLPNTDCVRLPLWSDPTQSYGGETRGVTFTAENQDPYSADMASALEIHMPIVAEWQSYPDSAPSTPGNFRMISEQCHGQSIAYWNSVSTAENYQVLRSYSSSFTNPEVIYFGTNTSLYVNVSQGQPWHLKVRACNGSGCGSLSAKKWHCIILPVIEGSFYLCCPTGVK